MAEPRPSPIDILASQILIDHTRRDAGHCLCGWGSRPEHIGQHHSIHVVAELRAAGLLVEVA